MYNCRTMRPKGGYEPFGSAYSSQASSRGSNDSVNATWKPPKGYSSSQSQTSSGRTTPSLLSQPGTFQPYQAYHEDEVPFDQRHAFTVEAAAPSFDEGTDATATTDDNDSIPTYQQPDMSQSEPRALDRHPYYGSELDDSVMLSDDSRERLKALHSQNASTCATQGMVYPDRGMYSEPEDWEQEGGIEYNNGSYPQGISSQIHPPMDYHSTSSFDDPAIAETPAPIGISSRIHPPLDYHVTSSYQELAAAEITAPKKKPRSILKRRNYQSESDVEDSTFASSEDSGDGKRKPRRSRDRLDPGNTSDEGNLSTGTWRRTKEAFDNREKNRSRPPAAENDNRGVSFEPRHRVHRYEQEEEEDNETTISGWTGETSVTSAYSKSMESEVEDLVKDLFFLGAPRASQPGRRRSRSDNRSEYEDATVGDSTLDTHEEDLTLNTMDDELATYDESTYGETTLDTWSTADKETRTTRSSEISNEDPITSMWNMMQGGVSAVGAALGVTGEETKSKPKAKSPKAENTRAEKTKTAKTRGVVTTNLDTTAADDELEGSQTATLTEMFEMASDFLMGSADAEKTKVEMATSLEDDGRLADLALYAARSKHEAHGLVFDETKEVDIVTEIQFSVVKVLLPMGILFQENPGGCWVTKVFASGNAALNAKGGTVEIGDQLAAVDGTSAVDLKVDKVCSLVSKVPKGEYVELTFLRYTGPLQSSDPVRVDEGYEVRDPAVERKNSKGKKERGVWKSRRKIKVEPPLSQDPPPMQKKKRFRIFGRGKKSF